MTIASCGDVTRAIFFLLLTSLTPQCLAEEVPLVHTHKGDIRGRTMRTAHGQYIDAYTAIPYAKPPIGKYRFKHPRPIDPWNGILDATGVPNSCFQINDTMFGDFEGSMMWNTNTPMSEDCLTLSIFVPKPKPKGAAVMVWIFGGGFYSGTSTLDVYDMKILTAEEQIITASLNYRVGSLGFLYFDRPDAPGNTGLFDQLMALEWIRDNIPYFGGNPLNVTLFGESAGAVSVGFHMLSPLSRNLFSQAILESGAATAPWAVRDAKEHIRRGLMVAEALKCPHDPEDMDAVMECLRATDPTELVYSEFVETGVVNFPFVPVVDGAFLVESPQESFATENFKKTNVLLGSNLNEGYYFIAYFLTDLFKNEEDVFVTRENYVTSVKKLFPWVGDLGYEAIMFEYTDWKDPNNTIKNREYIDRMVGDYNFACGIHETAMRYSETGNDVYTYFFTHRSSINTWPMYMGVMHADEINFILGEPLNPNLGYTKDEVKLSKRMMRYWANFAKTGNPTLRLDGESEPIRWPKFTPTGKEILTLAVNSTEIGHGHRAEQCAFWFQYLPKLLKYAGTNNPECTAINGAQTVFSSLKSLVLTMYLTGNFLSRMT